ncbi:MAG: DUF3592 domain-containing protein [Planctomycetota bacterium]
MSSAESGWSRPSDELLAERLTLAPGRSIVVEETDAGEIRVTVKVMTSRWFKAKLGLIWSMISMFGVIVMILGLVLFENDVAWRWWAGVVSLVVGVVPFGLTSIVIVLVLVVSNKQSLVVLGRTGFRLVEGVGGNDDSAVRIPWSDVQDLQIVRTDSWEWLAHTRGGWPIERGFKTLIAVETINGTLPFAGDWSGDVVEWLASLLAESPRTIEPEAVRYAGGFWQRIQPGLPQKIDRKSLVLIGTLGPVLCFFFAVWAIRLQIDAVSSSGWSSVSGRVVTVQMIDRDDADSYTEVTYQFTVDGKPFRSSRYGFGGSKVDHEKARKNLQVGDEVTVWYHPADPTRSVVDRSYPYGELAMSLICSLVGLVALGYIPYAILAKNSSAAEKYDVPAPSIDRDG